MSPEESEKLSKKVLRKVLQYIFTAFFLAEKIYEMLPPKGRKLIDFVILWFVLKMIGFDSDLSGMFDSFFGERRSA